MQAEHKPKHAEGPFFTSLLEAVGCPEPDKGSNPSKRLKLIDRIKDACARNGSGVVAMFFDEAQRYGENEYEWLRDVHDHLDRINIRLFTFLIGQEELHAVKTAFQQARKTQIVARLMVDELRFHGLRDPADTATCLDSYDTTCFPRGTDWGELEIPMESFARAEEIMLKGCWDADAKHERPAKVDGLPRSRPVAMCRRDWRRARKWPRPLGEPWKSHREAASRDSSRAADPDL